jgi:hypothetical protein
MIGDPRSLKEIVSAGLQEAERVVLINLGLMSTSKVDDFADSATIMISHLIFNTFQVCRRLNF